MAQIVVRITSQRGGPDSGLLASRMPGDSLDQGTIRFTVEDEPADVIVVINYLKYDTKLTAKKGFFWMWHNEPINRSPYAKGFDRIFTHEKQPDSRIVNAPPILDWWVRKSWDELAALPLPKKTKIASAIASTKSLISGHRSREEFVSRVEKRLRGVDVFGRGRAAPLADKWDGLAEYRFSIAIENTSKADYWTEKIADCFLSYTVPIYFGAPNIGKYFPRESFIWLPLDDPEKALHTVEEAISENSWSERVDALHEARERVLNQYSLFAQLSSRVRNQVDQLREAGFASRRVHGRRVRPRGWVRGQGLSQNVRLFFEKRYGSG